MNFTINERQTYRIGFQYIADLFGDGTANATDVLMVIGVRRTPNADITGDNMTEVSDLLVAIGEFSPCP
ncbi:MAG: hypothetical protein H8E86_02925 [Planctomycetes bacterium]|nr:hypothetical protein [Planctomycetota bacterium]